MTRIDLLESFKAFTELTLAELSLPERMHKNDTEQTLRAPEVHLMGLPDVASYRNKAPYIIHWLNTGSDVQQAGSFPESSAEILSIFCVYSDNPERGNMMLLEMAERLRIALLRQQIIDDRFVLDLTKGVTFTPYMDLTDPYYCGEMTTSWQLPHIPREVAYY